MGSARFAAIAAAFLAALVVTYRTAPAAAFAPPGLDTLPFVVSGWEGTDAPALPEDVAEVLAADEYVRRYYRSSAGVLEMDVAYYSQPRVGSNMHSPLNCVPGNGWEVTSVTTRSIQTSAGTWPVRELTVERGQTKYALTYWFQGRHRVIADEVSVRFYVLADALRRRPTDAGLVRLMTPIQGSGDAERAMLASFATHLLPELDSRLN